MYDTVLTQTYTNLYTPSLTVTCDINNKQDFVTTLSTMQMLQNIHTENDSQSMSMRWAIKVSTIILLVQC